MTSILFVCHGNICRSPMAEVIFKYLLEQRRLSDRFIVDSAAVSAEEIGNPTDFRANATLERHGLPRSRHIARQMTLADYERFDYILCMDMDNYNRLKRMVCGDPKRKAGLLMGYTDWGREVDDPWFTGQFDRTYEEIEEGCKAFLSELLRDQAR